MADQFQVIPAHSIQPGTTVYEDGVVFTTVFRGAKDCGLVLCHLGSKEEVRIPFTDEFRTGSLYSVKVLGLDPFKYGYRYYRDDITMEDPYARGLMSVTIGENTVNLCRCFPRSEDQRSVSTGRHLPWSDRVIYVMHAKGFTASKTSRTTNRGTFAGITEKLSYLKKLGVTAIELLPVYELRSQELDQLRAGNETPLTAEKTSAMIAETLRAGKEQKEKKENYWNFGEGAYFAPKASYAAGDPQLEFLDMVEKCHKSGIDVYLQLFFPENVSVATRLETARFYVTHYGVDGFHIKGDASGLDKLANDPILSDTALFYYSFPYEDLKRANTEDPTEGQPDTLHLADYRDDFLRITRKFVKSDDNVLREFVKAFVTVPAGHGQVHYVTNYDTFTLMDLVSYGQKHNEANGEDNRDGENDNFSWNCGVEGKSFKRDIRFLRDRQMRNFLTLNFLAQGTPLITAGDERCNSQDGNNNVYCQDNEMGWTGWRETVDGKEMTAFTQKITAFRRKHSVFRRNEPFKFSDYKTTGFPDVSFHGRDAWKPDFNGYSHTVGILLDENYAPEDPRESLLYLAINMHWHNQQLGVPTPPAGYRWRVIMDTFEEPSFLKEPELLKDQRHVFVKGRSVRILQAVKEFDPEVKKTTKAADQKNAAAKEHPATAEKKTAADQKAVSSAKKPERAAKKTTKKETK